jgi:lipopolysaccharide export system permease protein
MGTISRYILLELLKVFVVALTALTAFVIIFVVVREAIGQGLGPAEVFRMIPFALPQALQLTLPGTLLLTACVVYGRMAGSNEIMALKAMGISPQAVLRPVLILGLLLSIAAVWLNDVAVSWGAAGIQRVVLQAVESVAYGMLRTQRSYKSDQFEVTVKTVDEQTRTLIRPVIRYQEGKNAPLQISADTAQLRSDQAENALTIILHNARVEYGDGGQLSFYDNETVRLDIPLEAASRSQRTSAMSPSKLPMKVITPRIKDQKALIESQEEAMASEAAYQMITGEFDALASSQWEQKRAALADAILMLHRLETEPYRRWANGFSCLCFVLVGAPMAIRLRNSDVLTTFFICFLPILIVYYPLLTLGTESAKRGDLPPIAVWLDNAMLVCWGAWLLRRVFRY